MFITLRKSLGIFTLKRRQGFIKILIVFFDLKFLKDRRSISELLLICQRQNYLYNNNVGDVFKININDLRLALRKEVSLKYLKRIKINFLVFKVLFY